MIPLLDSYPHNLKRIVADAGYGNEENLTTLDKFGVEHLIKYSMFDKEQKRKQKHSPKNLDNWLYDDVSDTYTHPDGWDYHFESIKHSRTATGFQQDIRVYQADYPDLAPQKCLYVNQRYQELKRKESQALLSEEGGRIFAQRKVDVEPVFGQIKACLGYKRCNLRGKRQVKIDMGLVLMANNLLKYNRRMTKN
ncbi:putative transposase [Streptococcus pseudoporcinus]|uniref:transposase n=1 Tax=Streptococcus pseudoporcinus TaxID=361101 RepID=UPI001165BD7C|nr:transposase [Streptococcus pseudoporcinus]VUC69051.1 putative transposase [Streptococcus pseudoporcinus]VUC99631.1 putative transposase [Streptococcus pseudoporcinus]VUD00024.1 putative transposase [Streptococcus pseudoporcinus]